MDADLGDTAFDAQRSLPIAQRGDREGGLGEKPAGDVELSTADVSGYAGTHDEVYAVRLRRPSHFRW